VPEFRVCGGCRAGFLSSLRLGRLCAAGGPRNIRNVSVNLYFAVWPLLRDQRPQSQWRRVGYEQVIHLEAKS
jgi:hypothetical protein